MAYKWIVLVTLFSLIFARPDKRDPYDDDDPYDKSHEHGYKDPYDKSHEHGYDDPYDKSHKHGYKDPYGHSGEKNYTFWYKVKAKDHYGKDLHYGHHEEKKPNGRVKGHYHVLLPDTRKLNVWYYVDGYSGFVAKVNYTGYPVYPPPHGYGKSHYKRHSGEYKEPSGTYKEPSGEYKEPSGTYKEPSGEYKEPSGTYKEPSGGYGKPSKEYY